MGELVASRSMQMLDYLAVNYKSAHELVHVEVNELASVLGKIEKLLKNDHNSRKVLENMERIRNLTYSIEDALETWAVQAERSCLPSNNEKRRGFTRLLRRYSGRDDDGNVIYSTMRLHFKKHFILDELIEWLRDTFPEDVLESEHSVGIERTMAIRRSLRWPRQMYVNGMEEHFIEVKEDLTNLISLVAEDREHRLVSIWGVKGLGKTAMARKVYTHPQVRSRFNAFAWVSLDQDYESGSLLQNILQQLGAGGVKMSAEEQKKEAEDYRKNRLQNTKKLGAGAVKKSDDEEQEKGSEEKKKGAKGWKEGSEEQRKGAVKMKEDAEEKKGVVEKEKEDVLEKKLGTGEQKKGAEMKKKEGAEEKIKEDAEEKDKEKKEGAEEKIKEYAEEKEKKNGTEEKKEGAVEKEKEDVLEKKIGTEEQKKGADEKEKKESAEEKMKEDVEEKIKEYAEEKKMGNEEKKEGTEEKTNGIEEQKEGAEEKEKRAEEQKKGADEKKEGAEEKQNGAEEKEKGAEEQIKGPKILKISYLLQRMMKRGAAVVKKRAEEPIKGVDGKKEEAEEQKEGAEEQEKRREEKMLAQLKDTLKQNRCFIVIDGILEPSQWTDISSAFITEDTDTKFLLTTYDEATARVGFPYELRLLNEDEGWDLLQKYVFHGKIAPDLGLVPKLGKEIVRKCGYLPSKISSLGRTLSAMPLNEWHKVNDNVNGYLQTDDQSESNERSYDVVYPRYDHLPYCQKQCFLYLAMFKEDEDIDPEDISFLWMGEGMVSPQQQDDKEGTIMDATEYYLRELTLRGMLHVQMDELSANRRFMPLSLHNNEHELSLYMAEKEYFRLKVVDFSGGKEPRFDPYTLYDGTRRLAIHFNKLSSPGRQSMNATNHLRSLLFLNSDWEYVCLPVRISDFQKFTLLRVLHFVRCKFEGRELPEGIWKLLNLRYLGLLYCDLDKLPPSISSLRNLHVLNVRSYDDAKITIPNAISQMVRLKHLRLPHNSEHEQQSGKLKLDGLVDLETFIGFDADKHDVDSLSKLKKLRYLGTHASSNDILKSFIDNFSKSDGSRIRTNLFIEYKCDFTSPKGLAILEEVLMCPNLDALTFSMVLIHNFPNCGAYASKDLTQIKLIGCKLSEDPMEALGKFPNLRKLCLGYGAFVGKTMTIRGKGFPKLEYLEFRCLPNLEEWKVDKGEIQNLSTLTVKRCPNLKGIPEELTSISSLKNLEIELEQSLYDEHGEKYRQMFAFVESLNIRQLDASSVVLTKR